ncbi:Uncharacterised protein [uncultured archaeon]|nr:Uncharacterised protein [uncultured archaeon]
MAVTKTEMKTMEKRLYKIEIEIRRLKAVLIPTVKMSKKEQKELEAIRKDMAKGNWVSGRELIKKLG